MSPVDPNALVEAYERYRLHQAGVADMDALHAAARAVLEAPTADDLAAEFGKRLLRLNNDLITRQRAQSELLNLLDEFGMGGRVRLVAERSEE